MVYYTFDFFNRQRSQALHTRFRMLSCSSIELDRCDDIGKNQTCKNRTGY
jgi:hypothetical protein